MSNKDRDQILQMESPGVAILVVSCDRYQDLWPIFFHYFFKHWPDCPYPVYLGSNTYTYNHPKVIPILVGEDIDYSSNLIRMLENIPQEWVVLWVEDRILTASVRTVEIDKLVKTAKRENIGYIKLISGHPLPNGHRILKKIGEIPRYSRYRVCITVGLWRKNLLNQLLISGETPWEIEINGSKRSRAMDEKFYSISIDHRKNPPIMDRHLIIKGRVVRDSYRLLKNDGLLSFLHGWKKQSVKSYIYVKIHGFVKNAYSQSKWLLRRLMGFSIRAINMLRTSWSNRAQ